jgi:translocation and assembly module TamA
MRVRALRCGRALLTAACLTVLSPARADIDLEVRVNDELRSNVIAYLSLSRYRERELDAATVERLHNRVEREVRDALRPFGYYEPIVKSEVTPLEKGSWRAVIDIDPGPPVIVEAVEVRVTGPGAEDPQFRRIMEHPVLRTGERLSHAAYDQTKDDLLRTAATYGYLDARLIRSELKIDPPNRRASAALELESGVRYRFGATTIEQSVIADSLVRRYMRYHEDQPFDLSEVLRTQFALDDSQYFSTVEVLPGDPDRTAHTVPVSIRAQPSRRDRYSFGGGYGTDTGPRGTFLWDRRLVNTSGSRFSTQIQASAQQQLLESAYIIPIGDPALEKLSLGAAAESSTPGDLHNKVFSLGPSLTRVVGRFQYVWALTPMRAITDDANGSRADNLLIPSLTIASVPRGYLGEALFDQGFVAQLRAGDSLFGPSEKFLQAHIQVERAFPLATHWHLLLRGEAGATLVSNLNELPGSLRFFAGGDRSVRGFGWDDLSPVTCRLTPPSPNQVRTCALLNGNPIYLKTGGRHILTGSVEVVRDLPRNLGIAVFSDFGNAFDRFGQSPNPVYPHFIEYSAGMGVRWRLPVVTLGVDIAEPLSRPAGPRLHINFSPKL